MRVLKTNCPNCGGVLDKGNCPYCGTKVRYANELDIECGNGYQPVEVQLNIKQGDTVTILPLRGHISEVSITRDHHTHYSDGERYLAYYEPSSVEFVFNGVIDDRRYEHG